MFILKWWRFCPDWSLTFRHRKLIFTQSKRIHSTQLQIWCWLWTGQN